MKPVFLIFTCQDKNILYVNEQNKTNKPNETLLEQFKSQSKMAESQKEGSEKQLKDREFTIHQTSQGTKPSINPFYEFEEVFKIIL